jgi:tight adherence protein C
MIYLITLAAFLAATLLILAVFSLVSTQTRQVVFDRLSRIRTYGPRDKGAAAGEAEVQYRDPIDILVVNILQPLGRIFGRKSSPSENNLRRKLIMAGYYQENAAITFTGVRFFLALALPLLAALVMSIMNMSVFKSGPFLPLLAIIGLVGPQFILTAKINGRQLLIRNGLADALDLMVSCVEAGLSLNAALARVATELNTVHKDLAREFELTGLEMRTGKTREDALRNLGLRSGVKDLKSFTAMLIQTDKFGTSISRALRVFSDTLRTKRRQRAEEAAAQTTIKLVFPLVFFIFPTILIVLLGPGVIQVMEVLQPTLTGGR